MDDTSFPASVLPRHALSDHFPIVPSTPCDTEEKLKIGRKIKTDKLTAEEWYDRDTSIPELLRENQETRSKARREKNVDHFYNKLEGMIRAASQQDEVKHKPKNKLSPMQQFLKKHSDHPLSEELQASLDPGDEYYSERLLNQIGADGWKSFLGAVTRSNTRSLYAYSARADGRRKWGSIPADSAPVLRENQIVIRDGGKCEIIA